MTDKKRLISILCIIIRYDGKLSVITSTMPKTDTIIDAVPSRIANPETTLQSHFFILHLFGMLSNKPSAIPHIKQPIVGTMR